MASLRVEYELEGPAAAGGSAAAAVVSLEQQILGMLRTLDGSKITMTDLNANRSPAEKQTIAAAINKLLSSGLVEMINNGNAVRLIASASKLAGMDADERLIYQTIESVKNRGIWTRDLRHKTNIGIGQLNKTLKKFETAKLIKAVKSVAASKKKVYMLYDLEPDKTLSGGAWYSEQEFDSEFAQQIQHAVLRYLKSRYESCSAERKYIDSFVSCEEVTQHIADIKLATIALSFQEIHEVLISLVYGGALIVKSHPLPFTRYDNAPDPDAHYLSYFVMQQEDVDPGLQLFAWKELRLPPTPMATVPCGVCPVFQLCEDGGIISPETCQYMDEWFATRRQGPSSTMQAMQF
ncbi:polymerase III polypeptide F [Capsaspora owczarzaki ATCC 30864]|uniref:polymerase III polypeptide F n=1 Tax=Capsaspora owczarzaki (strain ATCC 30864) TaxID=595528 RepID=UPI0001FE3313|nr:polymerase III polypeptide F [Capsaspora owczarzaki ATCC 30864]|eukprot:XP_004363278.1 polymerase III polypeptide F [Capsaspora owczarzaki ATCC 30864]